LTACHTETSGIDHRFFDYMSQLVSLSEYSVNRSKGSGFVEITGKVPGMYGKSNLVILNSQQIRTLERDNTNVDINVIGVEEIIMPGRDTRETLRRAIDLNGIVLLSNVGDKTGATPKSAFRLYEDGLVHGIEVSSYVSPIEVKKILDTPIKDAPIITVTGGHNYKRAGTSNISWTDSTENRFSIDSLKRRISEGEFKPHYGHISRGQRLLDRDIHIYLSVPGHLADPKRRGAIMRALFPKRKGN